MLPNTLLFLYPKEDGVRHPAVPRTWHSPLRVIEWQLSHHENET